MITIITPTFNRAHTLKRLYASLCVQETCDFEWIIVDDGSNDGTDKLVLEFISHKIIKIIYLFQENSGKHIALNTGTFSARGEWIFIVDSDDALTVDGLSVASKKLKLLAEKKIAGICFRKADFEGRMIGVQGKFNSNEMVLKPTDAGRILKGDLAYIFRKDLMLKNLFPKMSGEKFVPELYIWNKIGDAGDIYFFVDKFIYLCEYLSDGYSRNFSNYFRSNPKGFLIFYRAQFFRENSILAKLKCLIRIIQCYLFISFKLFQ